MPLTTEKNHNIQFNIEVFGEKVFAPSETMQKLNEGDTVLSIKYKLFLGRNS